MKLFKRLIWLTHFIFPSVALAIEVPVTLFPLDNYNQNVAAWFPPDAPDYTTPLLNPAYQKQRFHDFFRHCFSTDSHGLSPWSQNYIEQIVHADDDVLSIEKNLLKQFSNTHKTPDTTGYGANFRPYTPRWIKTIKNNMHLSSLKDLQFKEANRAILVNNTYLRALPTHDPHFYRLDLPGQGYPFDNLQEAALWIGTPVYVISQTQDGAWSLIIASSLIGWVETASVAHVDTHFVKVWENIAKQRLLAITQTQTPIYLGTTTDCTPSQSCQTLTGYIGAVFPLMEKTKSYWKILIPQKKSDGTADIRYARIPLSDAENMPLTANRKNFALLLQSLQKRPYGWGGIYFYNDCSSELKNLLTPFGIWLPYDSSQQIMAGKQADISSLSLPERLAYLQKNGHPLMTLVYVNGHIVLYLGNYPNRQDPHHALMAMTYQNVWALKAIDKAHDKRGIIGESVFFPLLMSYPEDTSLASQANRSVFKMIYLDDWLNE